MATGRKKPNPNAKKTEGFCDHLIMKATNNQGVRSDFGVEWL